ncbi:hypothetical protein CVIC9261_06040 [Campylobacter vicugnae]|uniref:VP2 n=3 Tax=Campylobacter vicugnae TaxID=1660076 RepID=A0ABZ2E692_9BACT
MSSFSLAGSLSPETFWNPNQSIMAVSSSNPMGFIGEGYANAYNQLGLNPMGGVGGTSNVLGGEGFLGAVTYGAKVATDLLGAFMDYKNYKLQKDNYNFQKSIMQENMARQRHEWARQDKNRANISNSWNNGQSFSESLAGYNGDVNKLFGGNAYTPEFDFTFKNSTNSLATTAKANTTMPTATEMNRAKQVQNRPTTATPVNNVSKAA